MISALSGRRSKSLSEKFGISGYIKVYFNFAYFLCISPFRIKYNMGRSDFYSYKWIPQQIICACMHILCILRLITEIRLSIPSSFANNKNPVLYFELMMKSFNLVYKIVLIKQFWFNFSKYVYLLNYINKSSFVYTMEKSRKSQMSNGIPTSAYHSSSSGRKLTAAFTPSLIAFLTYSTYTTMAFLSLFAGKYFVQYSPDGWTSVWWYRRLIVLTRYTFFYDSWPDSRTAPQVEVITVPDKILSVVTVLSLLAKYLMGYFSDLSILSLTLTLWTATNSFSTKIQQEISIRQQDFQKVETTIASLSYKKRRSISWSLVYGNFQEIRKLSWCINSVTGDTVSWYLLEAFMYYSVNLDAFLTTEDAFKRVNLMLYFLCMAAILLFGADICKKLECVKEWYIGYENRKDVPGDEINMVLHEMLARDMGIRLSNIFTITYPLAATFVSTTVTYFIICVQHKVAN